MFKTIKNWFKKNNRIDLPSGVVDSKIKIQASIIHFFIEYIKTEPYQLFQEPIRPEWEKIKNTYADLTELIRVNGICGELIRWPECQVGKGGEAYQEYRRKIDAFYKELDEILISIVQFRRELI